MNSNSKRQQIDNTTTETRSYPLLAMLAPAALFAMVLLGATTAAGQSYPVVDTAQSGCYDELGNQITCPATGAAFSGQDAQHQGLMPQYVDHGDGTVSDQVTGLMWQQTPVWSITYAAAVAGAASVTTGGYGDWRLPTIKELYSLIDFDGVTGTSAAGSTPYIDTTYFDFEYGDTNANERFIDAQYASATEYVWTTMNGDETVFGVNFADGRIKGYGIVAPGGGDKTFDVRYVRAGAGYGVNDFLDGGDGTVTDRASGLMWSRADSGYGMNWQQALAWVADRNTESYLGHDDWRLPEAKELQSLVDYSRSPDTHSSAAIDPILVATAITNEGGAIDYPYFWASTTHLDGPANIRGSFAIYVAFGRALGWMESPPNSGNYQLLDVHGAGAQRGDPKSGDPADWPTGNGPQGDIVRIDNFVRLVREAEGTGSTTVPVAVDNSSFETPTLADGGWTSSIPSWDQISGVTGIFNPTSGHFPSGVTAGDNSAYLSGGTIGQTIAETVLADTTYTLIVDVGNRLDRSFPGYEIQLLVDGVVRASADETSPGAGVPASGTFTTVTASFTSTSSDAGALLEVHLLSPGDQVNFDNVALSRSVSGDAPAVSIDSPAGGSSFAAGVSIDFAGSATDTEDGDLSAGLAWTSDIDGAIGTGASLSTSGLSAGSHTITASVSDSAGRSGSDSISITVVGTNTTPVVTISGPASGSSHTACDTIDFTATASDTEDGDLSAGLAWTSDIDGAIGTGASFSLAGLSAGSHTITASVSDAGGLSGSDEIQITGAAAATLAITVDNFSFETPALADGGWTPSIPSWTQGSGTSGIFNPTAAHFPDGASEGEASAYSAGGTISQTITAEALLADTPYTFSVDIGNRLDRGFPGYEIQLLVAGVVRASADETSLAPTGGTFATATASFTTDPSDAGLSLEIRLLSSGNQTNFDNVSLTRADCGGNVPPTVVVTSPADGVSYVAGAGISFAGSATDVEDGDLSAGLAWSSSLDGTIGSGASFSTSSLSCGIHSIDASVSDSGDLAGTAAITVTVTGGTSVAITVDNPSFETPALADGGWTPSVSSWTQTSGVTGIFNPTVAHFPGGAADGDGCSYSVGGTISQTITAETVSANATYTLSVDVGDRLDRAFPGYEIQLLVAGVVRASADETATNPADGTFATATASFTATLPDAGASLEIRLIGSGDQVNFDNVRLTRSDCGA